jgi:hypothetical protein
MLNIDRFARKGIATQFSCLRCHKELEMKQFKIKSNKLLQLSVIEPRAISGIG